MCNLLFFNVGMHLTQLFWKMAQYMGIATIMLSQYAVSGCVKCIPHFFNISLILKKVGVTFGSENKKASHMDWRRYKKWWRVLLKPESRLFPFLLQIFMSAVSATQYSSGNNYSRECRHRHKSIAPYGGGVNSSRSCGTPFSAITVKGSEFTHPARITDCPKLILPAKIGGR